MAGMNRSFGYAVDRPSQTPAPGATINVYQTGTVTHIPLYADSAGVTPLANPFVADVNAYYDFYCWPQRIDMRFSGTGITTPYTLGDTLYQQTQVTVIYNVKAFGATGDGTTDDTTAFQTVLAAITAGGVAAKLQIPAGTYRLTAELDYLDGPPLTLEGDDRETCQLVWDDTANRGLVIDATNDPLSSNLTADVAIGDRTVSVVDGSIFSPGQWLFLDDTGTNTGTLQTRIHSISTNDLTLEDAAPCPFATALTASAKANVAHPLLEGIRIQDLTFACETETPIHFLTPLLISRCAWFTVDNCHFNGTTGPLLTTRQTYNGRITRCIFENALTVAGSGIENQTATGLIISDCSVAVCQFGITFASAPYCRVEGTRINGRQTNVTLGRGIRFGESANFGVAVGNNISDTNLYGIYSQDSAFCTFANNTISFTGSGTNPAEHGIQLGGFETDFCHHCTISGNIIRGCSGYGVSIAPSAVSGVTLYNLIVGNTISGCTQGAIIIFRSAYNVVVGNTVSAPGSTTVEGIIDVRSTGAGHTIITGNIIGNEDSTAAVAVFTNTAGGAGFNVVSGNILDQSVGALTYNLMLSPSADTFGQAQPLPPITVTPALSTDIETGANMLETTFFTTTVLAGTVFDKANQTQGFQFDAHMILNGSDSKIIRFKVGAAVITFTITNGTADCHLRAVGWVKPQSNPGFSVNAVLACGVDGTFTTGFVNMNHGATSGAGADPLTNNITFALTAQNNATSVAGQVQLTTAAFVPMGTPNGAFVQP